MNGALKIYEVDNKTKYLALLEVDSGHKFRAEAGSLIAVEELVKQKAKQFFLVTPYSEPKISKRVVF